MEENKCPNSDPNFDKILIKLFGSSTPEIRKKVYYLICIVIRLFLYSLVLIYKDHPSIPYIVGLASLAGMYNLYPSMTKHQQQWWSKRFQFIISLLLFIVCVLLLLKVGGVKTIVIPILLFISLFGGIFQSLFVTFC
jgi:hypothetical protein